MPGKLRLRVNKMTALLAAVGVGALAYMFMPSCSKLVDADDTLCHALAAEKDGVVDWPDDERWYSPGGSHVFDGIMECPWRISQDDRDYIEGFGIAQGHNWGDLGRADPMTFNEETLQVDAPLARTYNGYANMVYANHEGIDLNRARSLNDFEYYDTFLKWAAAFVSQKTYRVNGNCSRSCETVDSYHCAIARTVSGVFRNDYIDLYQTFFYDIDSIWRASTIMHEVRHARDQVAHTGGSGCSRKSVCDLRWSTAGSNTYELLWLGAYYWTPSDHPFITPARRSRAQALFATMSEIGFTDPVQWGLGKLVFINEIPEFYVEQAACSEDPKNPHYCLALAN